MKVIIVSLAIWFSFVAVSLAETETEEFSGSGPHQSSSGLTGFELTDWTSIGNDGSFSTNSFGESVYSVASTPESGESSQDGLQRIIGSSPFQADFEISNVVLSNNTFSAVSLTLSDPTDTGSVALGLVISGTDYQFRLFYDAGSGPQIGGTFTTSEVVERATLFLDYSPDLVNGGGCFEAAVELNETGVVNSVGTIDGSQYGFAADNARLMTIATQGILGNAASAEFDRFELVTQDTLLGDVNLDGAVNLLDVEPFVDRISSGTFQAEADINQDGVVNLLDVNPFVELLSGG